MEPFRRFPYLAYEVHRSAGKRPEQRAIRLGEVISGKSWNAANNTWTYNFVWGTISVQCAQSGNALNINVVTTNFGNSGIIFDGAVIYPFVLHFPTLPLGLCGCEL